MGIDDHFAGIDPTGLPRDLAGDDAVRGELADYLDDGFAWPDTGVAVPMPDEPSVAAWRHYADLAANADAGIWPVLQARLPQLRFPIDESVPGSEAYRKAVRRGDLADAPAAGLSLSNPDALTLTIHPTPAGHIPVLEPGGRDDFVTLLQALTKRNAPEPIPDSVGACIVGGFNNWDRVAQHRAAWEAETGFTAATNPDAWQRHFKATIVPNKPLYQDRFMILSDGPYSNLHGPEIGLEPTTWREKSRTVRLEHECTHYVTRRICGSMRNNVHDELIADYCGLVAAFGRFHSRTFQAFMGIDGDGHIRDEGRIQLYRGNPPLSDTAFAALGRLLTRAADHLSGIHDRVVGGPFANFAQRTRIVLALTQTPVQTLAAADGGRRVDEALAAADGIVTSAPPGRQV